MMYPCTKCGACCRKISSVIENLGLHAEDMESAFYFPYTCDATGACENLQPDMSCKVYNDRPLICNIDRLIDKLSLDKESFYAENVAACNTLMDLEKLPSHFRI
jgi:Fe-S-cluster containining protein